jgi:hypothetical protein
VRNNIEGLHIESIERMIGTVAIGFAVGAFFLFGAIFVAVLNWSRIHRARCSEDDYILQ